MIPKRDIESEGQLLNSQFAEFPPPLAYFKLLDAGEKRTEAKALSIWYFHIFGSMTLQGQFLYLGLSG